MRRGRQAPVQAIQPFVSVMAEQSPHSPAEPPLPRDPFGEEGTSGLSRVREAFSIRAIAVGTLLLKLPFATAKGCDTTWLTALFTATSAVWNRISAWRSRFMSVSKSS